MDVSLTIDGISAKVPAGISVLEAAKSIGIEIPALCYDPELSPVGACRLCVVEVEGMRNLPPACVTVVTEGMVVRTNTPEVIEVRKTILELLIANHPLDCLTCEKAGECLLQKYCYEYGIKRDAFGGEKHSYPLDTSSPFFERDNNKCILCGRCVRACEEIQGRSVISFAYRGFQTRVAPAFDVPMADSECVFCGSCVAACPVGALTEKDMQGKGRKWEITKVRTTCPYCGCGCTLDLNVKDGRLIGVTSTPEAEVNGSALCVKGRFGYQFVQHPDRLKTPLIKERGRFREATWEEAVSLVASKFKEIKTEYGPEAFGVLSSARATNEENYLIQKFARAVLGTNNVDHCARL